MPSRRSLPVLALSSLLFAAGAATGALAQPQPPKPEDVAVDTGEFFMSVDVNVVNIDVYVTDKQGNRVRGLTRDDFEVFEDRKPVQVTNFYAVDSGKAAPSAPATNAAAPEPAPGTAPAAPADVPAAAPAPDDQQLHLIVYIDNFNLRPFNRNRVMRELRLFLNQNVRKGDQVMLVTYDREIHVRRGFTSDPAVIASALVELEKISAQGTHFDSERREILREIDDSRSLEEVSGRVRTYAESLFNDLSFTLNALKDFTGSLAGLPGRKAILYVSDGLPMRAAEDVYYKLQDKYERSSLLDAQNYDASRRFQELANQANANRVTFYTLEATGLRVGSAASAEESRPGATALIDSVFTSNVQSPLLMLAEKTGGRAVINTNSVLPDLLKIAADFDTYYSLGYTPSHSGDGRYYKIEVKVKNRKGLNVRHRDGYRDKTTETRMADGTMASLLFGVERNPLEASIEFGKGQRRDDGNYEVMLKITLPIGKLTLVPIGDTHEGHVRAYVAVMDLKGDTTPVQEMPIVIRVPAADLAVAVGKNYGYELKLLMAPGQQRVAVALRDEVSSNNSFLRRAVTVGQ
jgi:VWFA-related protein